MKKLRDPAWENYTWYNAFAGMLSIAFNVFSYCLTEEYINRWYIVLFIFLTQLGTALTLWFILSKKGLFEKTGIILYNITIFLLILPVSILPPSMLLVDNYLHKDYIGINAEIIDKKTIITSGRVRTEKRILVFKTNGKTLEKSVLWSFYNNTKIGSKIKLDLRFGILGFNKITDYYY
jgi:hypothetical protein